MHTRASHAAPPPLAGTLRAVGSREHVVPPRLWCVYVAEGLATWPTPGVKLVLARLEGMYCAPRCKATPPPHTRGRIAQQETPILELVLIRGLPGAGKSTLARTLAATHVHLEADMFFLDAQGHYVFAVEQLPQAYQWCLEQTAAVLTSGQNVVVANTFVRNAALAPYFALAQQVGAVVRVWEATGTFPNEHGVPEAVIDQMRQEWEPLRLPDHPAVSMGRR